MAYVYVKPQVKKKNDTTVITVAINEASIGRLLEKYCLSREVFLVQGMSYYLSAEQDSSLI